MTYTPWGIARKVAKRPEPRGKGTYRIVRFKYPDFIKPVKVVKTGLTLEEAQAHCRREDTHEEYAWFDGYEEE